MYAPLESVGLTLRATTRTPDTETPWPDPGTAPIEELRGWIHDLHTRDHALIEAPAVASPSLVRQLDAIVGADAVAAKKVRRAAVSPHALSAPLRWPPHSLRAVRGGCSADRKSVV